MTTLLTGATGFVGRHLVRTLAETRFRQIVEGVAGTIVVPQP